MKNTQEVVFLSRRRRHTRFSRDWSSDVCSSDLVYHFYVPEGGNYKVYGRARVPSADDDSFWVSVNDGDWVNWNGIQGGSTWQRSEERRVGKGGRSAKQPAD